MRHKKGDRECSTAATTNNDDDKSNNQNDTMGSVDPDLDRPTGGRGELDDLQQGRRRPPEAPSGRGTRCPG